MKKLGIILAALLLCGTSMLPVSATSETHPPRVVDEADLLSLDEESRLENELDEMSERLEFDVVVVTVDSLGGKSAEAFADDYYEHNGYGYGEEEDGALFLVSMEYRDWHISTSGYGISALHDRNLMHMEDEILPDLSEGYYYDAFRTFGKMCEEYVTEARTTSGTVKDVNPFLMLPVCLLLGCLFAGIPVSSMKRQMKSVRARTEASDYIKRDKVVITRSRDAFLYRNVSRQRKPEPNTSTTHRSSSGRSHGGRGGKF